MHNVSHPTPQIHFSIQSNLYNNKQSSWSRVCFTWPTNMGLCAWPVLIYVHYVHYTFKFRNPTLLVIGLLLQCNYNLFANPDALPGHTSIRLFCRFMEFWSKFARQLQLIYNEGKKCQLLNPLLFYDYTNNSTLYEKINRISTLKMASLLNKAVKNSNAFGGPTSSVDDEEENGNSVDPALSSGWASHTFWTLLLVVIGDTGFHIHLFAHM